MASAIPQSDYLVFGDLLDILRQHGFPVGLDHYLRLQALLDKIDGRCAPEELRTLLCPIFATSKNEQEQFYIIFDSYFDLFQKADEITETDASFEEREEQQDAHPLKSAARLKWLYVLAPVAVAAIVISAILLFRPNQAEQSTQSPVETQAAPQVETSQAATKPDSTSVKTEDVPTAKTAQEDTSKPAPQPTPQPTQTFYERHSRLIHLAIILLPLFLFLLYEWFRFVRRKLLLEKQQEKRPPFIWPIQVTRPETFIYDSDEFYTAARSLRRRQTDEFLRLDVEATVAATVESLGFPNFRYRSDSRVSEYLILIDRVSYRDHQARLFDELVRELELEGVFIARYFYDGDPRICRNEQNESGVQLSELQNRFANHRLIIFGNGEKLIDPLTGKLEGWTALFHHWQDRALLTIEETASWSLREVALAQAFVVLPASLNGLLAVVDYFETTVPEDLRAWKRGGFDDSMTDATPQSTIRALRRTLGVDTFQWLSACAVYTELQWDLTLHLGALPEMPAGLITESNLLKLIRLSWFRTGVIPDELRWLLINELTPERQRAVRAAIIELLEKDPPPPETFASDQYHLNLFAQRWLESRTRKRLRELLELMKRLPRSQSLRDLTLVRFLESARLSPLDFILPERLRKLFYHRGVPAFGLKTGARFLVTLLMMSAAWIGIKALTPTEASAIARSEEVATSLPPKSLSTPTPEAATESATEPNPTNSNNNQSTQQLATEQKQKEAQVENRNVATASATPAAETNSNKAISLPIVSGATSDAANGKPSIIFGSSAGGATGTNQVTVQNEPPPPPPVKQSTEQSSAPQKPSAPISLGVLNRRAKSLPKPLYPEQAMKAGIQGLVQVQVVVDESGKVIGANATSGDPQLQMAALEAAYKARFAPTIISGQAVKIQGVLNYTFTIQMRPQEPNGPQQQQGMPPRNPGGGRPPH
ncbi:MAG TPA: TonB family protein [Pyrinomonadaceae bacterium]|nr:TonB family protein [Pyrinomonadaceae bacterium]